MFYSNFKNKNINVIISAVNEYDKISNLDITPNIHIFKQVPQLEVLNYTNLFITHGGMNSVNEGMFMGVPMIVAPVALDQPTNAKLIQNHGLGINVDMKKIIEEELQKNVDNLLNNKTIINNCLNWKQKQLDSGGVNKAVEIIKLYLEQSVK